MGASWIFTQDLVRGLTITACDIARPSRHWILIFLTNKPTPGCPKLDLVTSRFVDGALNELMSGHGKGSRIDMTPLNFVVVWPVDDVNGFLAHLAIWR